MDLKFWSCINRSVRQGSLSLGGVNLPRRTAAAAYDIGILLGGAAKKCGLQAPQCIVRELTQVGRYSGVGGTLILGKDRLPMRPHGLKQFQGGTYRWIVRELAPIEIGF